MAQVNCPVNSLGFKVAFCDPKEGRGQHRRYLNLLFQAHAYLFVSYFTLAFLRLFLIDWESEKVYGN